MPKEEQKQPNIASSTHTAFRPGDTVKVYYKIVEGGNVRIQPFEGIVIARKGIGLSRTFTVRRIGSDSIGVERIFPLMSPNITKIEVIKMGNVRRAKLYYLRAKQGKEATRVKELGPKKLGIQETADKPEIRN